MDIKTINLDTNNPYIQLSECKDNSLVINGKKYFSLCVSDVIVGTNIGSDSSYKTNTAKEVHCPRKQVHSAWFLLDLETGRRGKFPGANLYGKTNKDNVFIFAEKNDSSQQVAQITKAGTSILLLEDNDNPYWYHCKINDTYGYTRIENLDNLYFA